MKTCKTTLWILCIVSASLSVSAGFRVPSSVFRYNQLEEAAQEARRDGKALSFVFSHTQTTCPLCENATEESFKRLKRHSVIVYLDSADSWKSEVSPLVRAALGNKFLRSNTIPRVAVVSPDQTSVWGVLPYEQMKDRGNFRDLEKQIDALVANPSGPKPEQPEMLFWQKKGTDRGYFATFEKLDGDTLHLKLKNGKVSGFPLDLFVTSCVAYARQLSGQPEPVSASYSDPGKIQNWTGTNGKVIQAAFVSLEGDVVSLRNPMGSTYRFPLSRLDEASQTKAKAFSQR